MRNHKLLTAAIVVGVLMLADMLLFGWESYSPACLAPYWSDANDLGAGGGMMGSAMAGICYNRVMAVTLYCGFVAIWWAIVAWRPKEPHPMAAAALGVFGIYTLVMLGHLAIFGLGDFELWYMGFFLEMFFIGLLSVLALDNSTET